MIHLEWKELEKVDPDLLMRNELRSFIYSELLKGILGEIARVRRDMVEGLVYSDLVDGLHVAKLQGRIEGLDIFLSLLNQLATKGKIDAA